MALVDVLNGSDSLFLSLVGKHRAEGAVSEGANVGDLGAVLLVNDQAAPLISLETNVVKTETGSVWAATDSNEDTVRIELGMLALQSASVAQNRLTVSSFPPFAASTLTLTPAL